VARRALADWRAAEAAGGGSGIGRATAVALARDGFDIGFTWHSARERVDEVEEEIEQEGRRSATRVSVGRCIPRR